MIRSFLFVPGDSEKKLAKLSQSPADAAFLDIEDSVAPERKAIAREMVAEYVAAHRDQPGPELWVRINPLSICGLDDLAAVVRSGPAGLMVPKSDGPEELLRISIMLDALERRDGVTRPIKLFPVATETPAAPFALGRYAQVKVERLAGMTWGAEDLSTALGARTNLASDGRWALTYRMARSMCLMAARAAGVPAYETMFADFRDDAGLRAFCSEAAREGFSGLVAIHPAQVQIINEAFTPSAEEVAFAERVVAAFAAEPGSGVVGIDGKMFDIPHLKMAQGVLAQAAAVTARAQAAGGRAS